MTIVQLFKFMCACLHGSKMRCGRFSDKSEIFATWSLLLYVEILHRLTKLKEKSEMNAVHETKGKKLSLLWRPAPKPVAILQSVSSQGSARNMTFFFGLFNGFSTMTTHNDELTWCIQHVSQVMLKCCRLRAPHLAGLTFTWCDLNWS